jgi:hypothetical protein
MICPECGTRLSEGEIQCHFCGHTEPTHHQEQISRDVVNISIGVLFGLFVCFLVPGIGEILFKNPIIGIAVIVAFFGNLLYLVYRSYRNGA